MKKIFTISLILFCVVFTLKAREPYRARITLGIDEFTVSASNLLNLKRDLRLKELEKHLVGDVINDFIAIDLDLRGLEARLFYPTGSPSLVVIIPQADINVTFTGATREDSFTLFKESVRDGGPDHNLLKSYARYSPIDPVAGNPDSLMASMGEADYLAGHLSPLSGCNCGWKSQPIVNQVQIGAYLGRSFPGGFDTSIVRFPLRYSFAPNLNCAFIIDAPFTYVRNGGASSIFGSIGIGFRMPLIADWSLTPMLRLGTSGSLDLCTSASFFSAGITSVFNYKLSNYVFSLTNYAGYITSTNLWLSGVNFNYHLQNYIFKNGIAVTTCNAFNLCRRPINFSLSFVDSYFDRERLYIRHYDEITASVIVNNVIPQLCYDSLILGFTYKFGQHKYKGYFLNLAYQF